MVKLVALVRKHPHLAAEAFRDHWLRVHAPLAAAIPGLRGYRINIAGDPAGQPPAPYDGSAELWFDDRAALRAGLASAEGLRAGADAALFAQSIEFLVTEEHEILPPGPAP